jgi:hypothetical protein
MSGVEFIETRLVMAYALIGLLALALAFGVALRVRRRRRERDLRRRGYRIDLRGTLPSKRE